MLLITKSALNYHLLQNSMTLEKDFMQQSMIYKQKTKILPCLFFSSS